MKNACYSLAAALSVPAYAQKIGTGGIGGIQLRPAALAC